MGRVDGKVAVVTGGARGIGRATCELLAREGARVAVVDLAESEGRQVAQQIGHAGGTAGYWRLDVSDERQVATVFSSIAMAFGSISVLVNNAGISGSDKPTHALTVEEWDQLFAVNVKGVFLCTRQVLPDMMAHNRGSIINLSSIYGLISAPDVPPYHAAKGAVHLMSKTDALLYAKDNIRVNSVHPGFIWTPMVEAYVQSKGGSQTAAATTIASLHPLGRIGQPIDVAYGILYLASDESSFVTGSELVIDGGYTAR